LPASAVFAIAALVHLTVVEAGIGSGAVITVVKLAV
jgi:hypothetical protein